MSFSQNQCWISRSRFCNHEEETIATTRRLQIIVYLALSHSSFYILKFKAIKFHSSLYQPSPDRVILIYSKNNGHCTIPKICQDLFSKTLSNFENFAKFCSYILQSSLYRILYNHCFSWLPQAISCLWKRNHPIGCL